MFTSYLFTALIVYLSTSAKAEYSNCAAPNAIGELKNLSITNCDVNADSRCIFKRNSKGTMTLTFKALQDIDNVKAIVHGVVLDVPMPFPLPNPDGCKDSGLKCPLGVGEYSYVSTLPIDKKYPRIIVDVKWELVTKKGDGSEVPIACVLIPSKLI